MGAKLPRWCVLFACVTLSACFRPGGGTDAADAGEEAGTSGHGGRGGTSGDGAGGVAVGAGGGLPLPPQVECGGSLCESLRPSPMFGISISGCCSPLGRCSLHTPGSECVDLGDPDPLCGAVLVGNGELPGCCVDGLCGVNFANIGLPCMGPDLLESLGLKPELRPCFGLDAGPDAGPDASFADDAGH